MYAEVDIIEYAVWCANTSAKGFMTNIEEYLKDVGTRKLITNLEDLKYKSSKMYIKIKPGTCVKFNTEYYKTYNTDSFIKKFDELIKINRLKID